MASLMRPALLRQACQAPAFQQRFLSTAARQSSPLAQSLRPAFSAPSVLPKASRVAAFHATQRQQILPPLPQKIEGTLNEPVKVPTPEYAHGSYHWTFERYGMPDCLEMRVFLEGDAGSNKGPHSVNVKAKSIGGWKLRLGELKY